MRIVFRLWFWTSKLRSWRCLVKWNKYKLCIQQHIPNFWVLLCGRLAGGMATSILFSAFESWVICEHDKVMWINSTYRSTTIPQLTRIERVVGWIDWLSRSCVCRINCFQGRYERATFKLILGYPVGLIEKRLKMTMTDYLNVVSCYI